MASEVIKLNIIPTGEMPVFHCSQFDNGRLINIELYRGEDAYTIPEGCTAELHCRKVDGNIVTVGSPVVDENTIKFTSTTQLTACNGKNLCEVAILGADDYLIGSLNFWLEVEIDPLKGGINSTSEIHDLYEQIEDITEEVIGDNYYDKSEVDTLLADKADVTSVYTKTETDAKLALKANASSVYTKSETDTLLLTKADASDVYTKGQVETKLAAKADAADVYTKSETDTLLDAKANANGVYSKVEVDAMVDDLEDAIDLKADQSTTYTKTEVDTALALKANAADVYTKTQVDTALALKANAADVYTKAETDAKIEEAIEDILPVDTAGPSAIASFTSVLALPLVDCEVGIVATGGNGTPDNPNPIVGYSSANITRCGKNLINNDNAEIGTAWNGSPNSARARLVIPCQPSTNYVLTMNGTMTVDGVYFGESETIPPSGIGAVTFPKIFTTASTSKYITLGFNKTNIAQEDIDGLKLQLELGSTPSEYHAYNGTTVTVAFGQAVYGGVLDVTRGKLKPCIEYPSYNGETLSGRWLSSEATYVEGTTPPTGSQVVSLDDYGADIDLTPVQIRALVGTNNVFADTNGNTTVKFKDTIQNYIDKKVST